MKLLYVENSLIIHGGIERVLTDKLNWLVEYGGFEVCLLLANQGNNPYVFPLSPKVECHNLNIMFHQVYRYSLWKRYFRLYQLRKLFRRRISERIQVFSPAVVVCTRLDFICDVMKVRGSIPVIYESHDSFMAFKFEKYSWFQKLRIKMWHHALKDTQMIISLTQGDALEWKKLNPDVHVIPNLVHLNNTGRYSDCSTKSAIFVGRFSYQKDIPSLIRVWELVCQRHPDWQLHILGGYGDQKDLILSEINKLDKYNNIVIHQPTTSIYEKYINCSMLLLTSRYESFGLVIPEAMSCGIPVVAFDCPYGPADIITDGVDGFLVSDRNIEDFVNKVCMLMENQELRIKMGKAGLISSQRYDTHLIMPIWKQLFERFC